MEKTLPWQRLFEEITEHLNHNNGKALLERGWDYVSELPRALEMIGEDIEAQHDIEVMQTRIHDLEETVDDLEQDLADTRDELSRLN